MNKHIFFDNLTANIGALILSSKKFFAGSTDSQSFVELISATELSVPEINSEGTFEVRATSKNAGELDPAFRVEKWLGVDHPSIIYHHGNNERPFDYRKRAKNSFMDIFVKAREYTISDKLNFMNGSMFSLEHMWNEVIHANLINDIDSMQVPVYIFHGKHDFTTPYSVAKEFYDQLKAPQKEFFTFENSAHSPVMEEVEKFNSIVMEITRKH